ncbi:MAG: 50S ribosomal protein L24 [Elusimicrobia bacterium]|nr:50S ribosomal protein L24 [Elusimicrobiota bacterium]
MKLKKKDTVMVISGRDKGKRGEVLRVYAPNVKPGAAEEYIPGVQSRILVAKVNMVTRHKKPRQNEPGGIQKMEAPIAVSKVMLVCPKCDKPTRPKLDRLSTGERVRKCRGCDETIL